MRGIGIVVLLLCLVVHVQAQEDVPEYRLRVPTATEYIDGLPDFLSVSSEIHKPEAGVVIRAAETEFLLRYGDQATSEILSNAFEKFRVPVYCYMLPRCGEILPEIDQWQWTERIFQAWLNENPTDLDRVSSLSFGRYHADITKHDFSGDGIDEWLLEVLVDDSENPYANYLVVYLKDGAYRVTSIPFNGTLNHWEVKVGKSELRGGGIEDINADGIPEWVFSWDDSYVSPGSRSGWTDVRIFSWRDGEIVRIASIRGNISYQNLDTDPAMEIVVSWSVGGLVIDSWGCGKIINPVYDWVEDFYVQVSEQVSYLDCTARYAEEAMWNNDFEAAARLYDEYIAQHQPELDEFMACLAQQCDCCQHDDDLLILQYFKVRRIIAYALLGDTVRVQTLLQEIQADEGGSYFEDAVVQANSVDTKTICQAAYDFYETKRQKGFRNLESETFMVGNTAENIAGTVLWGGEINPYRAGCDIRLFSETPTPIPTATPTLWPTYPPATPDARPQIEIWITEANVHAIFASGDYANTLLTAEQAVPYDEFDAVKFRYYRALALEFLNRPDEALAEYVVIYEAAPESVWGQLAALHLECVVNCG